MTLKEYKKKRKFKKTPEPPPSVAKKARIAAAKKIFVVQKHFARNLHYDFRLEMYGVLKSWAVPKGVPEKPGIKHLAVMVEDHPLEYANFSGVIPQGEYGAGLVEIWDKGTYEMVEATEKAYKIMMHGKILKGEYVLFNFKNDKNWLLFKTKI